ncbi:MAG TPA: ABC transporter ATP-binding protein [Candidatus Poseidoniales archaeon]|nr:teichoic acid ABC transporter ATP-binding protein [Euryarchaeota archaeon]DAC54123.1 MAG TPA: ABC transporter ATP-binding protein [Candidatus Poseidoniales archaeon]HII27836.1 ABC transporter ATP-binding protein [Poseidonia sp.]|tara:strand:- start:458 stop:1177 length:720 start_codon:yes stop_codon:yes gene_type:complete
MTETSISLQDIVLHFPKQRNIFGIISDFFRKKIRRFTALSGVNLHIKQGEVVGIIGRNGSGKSTLLRVISGIYPPDEGMVHAAGDISLLAGLGTGFSPHQTGRENALLYGSILGHSEEEMLSKLDEIIEFSELGSFIDEPLRTYSAGMKARLGLAVASAIKPNILLIDEVLGVGDPNFREKSKNKILAMVKGASTVVIVSHSFGLMTDVCDRVVLLDRGKIIAEGDPQTSIKAYYDLEE